MKKFALIALLALVAAPVFATPTLPQDSDSAGVTATVQPYCAIFFGESVPAAWTSADKGKSDFAVSFTRDADTGAWSGSSSLAYAYDTNFAGVIWMTNGDTDGTDANEVVWTTEDADGNALAITNIDPSSSSTAAAAIGGGAGSASFDVTGYATSDGLTITTTGEMVIHIAASI